MIKYDFENDFWPDDERLTYKLMKWWYFTAAYRICAIELRDQVKGQKRVLGNAAEYVWAYEQSESNYLPIEKLMLEVIALITDAGRRKDTHPDYEINRYKNINKILEKDDLQNMLKELPKEEREEFGHDLKLLGIMS